MTRSEQIASLIARLPEHLRPRPGSFEDHLTRACAESALAAEIGPDGTATVRPADLLYIARLLCGRGLGEDCYDTCRLQRQCTGTATIVLASFGAQARAYIEALGLRSGREPSAQPLKLPPRKASPALMDMRKVESKG